jgi:hypothetical protein
MSADLINMMFPLQSLDFSRRRLATLAVFVTDSCQNVVLSAHR